MAGDTQESRYARLSAESVTRCAESLDVQASQEVASSLVEDVSFRIRQLTDTASQFMRHAKRRRLTVEDFDKALKWSSIEPLYGHSTSEPPGFHFIHESGLFSLHDHDVKVGDIALASPLEAYPLPQAPNVKATWLSIEGVSLGKGGSQEEATVELQRASNESQQKYLSLILEAVTGDSEDLRRIALTDIQTNCSIANILPDLVQYLQETLGCWVQFTPAQLLRVLKLLLALFRNTSLFLDPYAPALFPLVKSTLLNPSYLHSRDGFDHWHLRQIAASCLAEIVKKCGSPLNDYIPDLHASFQQVLTQPKASLPVLYGAVLTLCHMGGKVLTNGQQQLMNIAEVLLPHLDVVTTHVQSLLEPLVPAEQEHALRVYETLLLAAELLLTTDAELQLTPDQFPCGAVTEYTSDLAGISEPGFFGPTPMEIGGAIISGMEEPPRDMPTLYDYLVEVFGERLNARLAGHQKFRTVASTVSKVSPESLSSSSKADANQPTETKAQKDTSRLSQAAQQQKEDSFMHFLSREGFKPVRVPMTTKVTPPPLKAHSRGHKGRPSLRFAVSQRLLPSQSNVLGSRPAPARKPPTETEAALKKGSCQSYKTNATKLRERKLLAPSLNSTWL